MRDTRNLDTLFDMLTVMREHEQARDMSLNMLLIFTAVARRGEVLLGDIPKLVGLSDSAVGRNVLKLGSGEGENPGLGLLASVSDKHFPQRKLVRITHRGMDLARELDDAEPTKDTRVRVRGTHALSAPAGRGLQR